MNGTLAMSPAAHLGRACRESWHRCPESRGCTGPSSITTWRSSGRGRSPASTSSGPTSWRAARLKRGGTSSPRVGARAAPPDPGPRGQASFSGERGARPAGTAEEPSAATPHPRGARRGGVATGHVHRGLVPRRLARRDRYGARPPRLLRPQRPARPRAVHPLRAPHDRRRPRRSRQGADRAGPRVPPRRDLRRGAGHPAPGHPGRRGQELLLPFAAWTTARCPG